MTRRTNPIDLPPEVLRGGKGEPHLIRFVIRPLHVALMGGSKSGVCMEVHMTRDHDFKKAVRARMEKTGESYVVARKQMLAIKEPRSSMIGGATWHRLVTTTKEEAEGSLLRALEAEPRLTYAGLGVWDPFSRCYWMPGEGPGTPETRKAFEDARAELWQHLEEIAACADWVRLQRPISSFNPSHHSYGYKHIIERWVEDRGGPHLYIANGSFVAAAVGLGFDARQTAPGSPNAYFRFSRKTVKAAIQASGEAANNDATGDQKAED